MVARDQSPPPRLYSSIGFSVFEKLKTKFTNGVTRLQCIAVCCKSNYYFWLLLHTKLPTEKESGVVSNVDGKFEFDSNRWKLNLALWWNTLSSTYKRYIVSQRKTTCLLLLHIQVGITVCALETVFVYHFTRVTHDFHIVIIEAKPRQNRISMSPVYLFWSQSFVVQSLLQGTLVNAFFVREIVFITLHWGVGCEVVFGCVNIGQVYYIRLKSTYELRFLQTFSNYSWLSFAYTGYSIMQESVVNFTLELWYTTLTAF